MPISFSTALCIDNDIPCRPTSTSIYESPPSPCILKPVSRDYLASYGSIYNGNILCPYKPAFDEEDIHDISIDNSNNEDTAVDAAISKLFNTNVDENDTSNSPESNEELENILYSLQARYQAQDNALK